MSYTIIAAEALAQLEEFDAILDVRSPGEFAEDHVPGAENWPVLDDEERRIIGTLYIGFFANDVGLIYSGSFEQLGKQALGAGAVLVYSFVLALVIGFIVEKTMGFRIKNEDELAGIDAVVHGEEGYALADA